MRPSLKGGQLPESEKDFVSLLEVGGTKFQRCFICKRGFLDTNTVSKRGWAETQISGYCEECFNNLFKEE